MTKFFAYILVTVGGLIAALSGLCSLAALAFAVLRIMANDPDVGSGLPMVLLFGGIPFATGAALFAIGVYLLRRLDRRDR